jgi:outer membrane protein OmpA-like peptidoglycan-associated protein
VTTKEVFMSRDTRHLHEHRSRPRLETVLIVVMGTALAVGWPAVTQAQKNARRINVQVFEPSTHPAGVLTTDPAATLGNLNWYVGLGFGYANDPLVATRDDEVTYRFIEHHVMADLVAAIGFWHYFELGVHLPAAIYQKGDPVGQITGPGGPGFGEEPQKAAIGDLRIAPKVRFWKNTRHGFGLAFVPQLTVPTGMVDDNAGEESATFEPKLVVDYRFAQGTLIALNVGYRLRKRLTTADLRVDDQIFFSLGVEMNVWQKKLSVLAEVYGAFGYQDAEADADSGIDQQEVPLEALGGVRYRFGNGLLVTAAGGAGLLNGWATPDFRVFGSVGFSPPAKAKKPKPKPVVDTDRDDDGLANAVDKCPDRPEDKDGFDDQDGCPDPDNDKDGLCDSNPTIQNNLTAHSAVCQGKDLAPTEPEDKDGFEDQDGKPDPDNDKDGVCDPNPTVQNNLAAHSAVCQGKDLAPTEPEDKDGFEDQDGKPDPDNDKDGVCDPNPTVQNNLAAHSAVCQGKDLAPTEPEDKDGFEDQDGRPDPDNDGDGFCDNNATIQKALAKYASRCKGSDQCPDKAETINGVKDDDGCPDKGRVKVILTRKKIRILEKIYFRTGRARIRRRSYKLLRVVAATLKKHSYIKRVRIEGHTDQRGSDRRNKRLSQRRANAVKAFLVKRGIEPARLEAKGYGETKPVQENCRKLRGRRKRKKCWAKNRRVEFTILEQKTRRVLPRGGKQGGQQKGTDLPPAE